METSYSIRRNKCCYRGHKRVLKISTHKHRSTNHSEKPGRIHFKELTLDALPHLIPKMDVGSQDWVRKAVRESEPWI